MGYKQSLLPNAKNLIGLINKHHSNVVFENREYLNFRNMAVLNFLELLNLRAKDNHIIQELLFRKRKTFMSIIHI